MPDPLVTEASDDVAATHTEANVEDDEVLPWFPQLMPKMVSSPDLSSSEQICVGGPTTPIAHDEFWEEQHPNSPPSAQVTTRMLETPQDTPEDMEKTTPSP